MGFFADCSKAMPAPGGHQSDILPIIASAVIIKLLQEPSYSP